MIDRYKYLQKSKFISQIKKNRTISLWEKIYLVAYLVLYKNTTYPGKSEHVVRLILRGEKSPYTYLHFKIHITVSKISAETKTK